MKAQYGVDSMPETAENVAIDFKVGQEDQDRFALASQEKAIKAQQAGHFDAELTPVSVSQKKASPSWSPRTSIPRKPAWKRSAA